MAVLSLHVAVRFVPPRIKLFCGESRAGQGKTPRVSPSFSSTYLHAVRRKCSNPHSTATSQACLSHLPSVHGQGYVRPHHNFQHPFYFSPSTIKPAKSSTCDHSFFAISRTLIVSATNREVEHPLFLESRPVRPTRYHRSILEIHRIDGSGFVARSYSVTLLLPHPFLRLILHSNPYHQPSAFWSFESIWNESIPPGLTSITFPRSSI